MSWRGPGRLGSIVVAVTLALTGFTAPAAAAAQASDWWQSLWRLDEVWRISQGEGAVVAVLDSGVDVVPELAGAVRPGTDLSGEAPDGRIDYDEDTHGTEMALMIAGRGTVSGLRGVAPAATILPIAFPFHADYLFGEGVAQGILFAVENGAHIVNISMAGPTLEGECPQYLSDAVRYAISRDVIVVAGSGNFAEGPSGAPGNCPGVITVGAIGPQLEPWRDSHRSEYVAVAAPGVELASPSVDGRIEPSEGTSNSAALVSGTLALLRSAFPEASADDLVTRLVATTQDLADPGRDDATGHGLVRPLEALTATVPADAPNPVYDPLGDLTGIVDPPTVPYEPPPSAPDLAPPPVAGESEDPAGIPLLPVGLVAAGVALLTVVAIVVVARSRRAASAGRHAR